jgi:transcriptional regulator with PAS, ATPase and Fis domain/tetratricopeptide (TPR) repeat protein
VTSTGREQLAREDRPAAGAPGADEAATGRRHARAGLVEPALRHLLAARGDRERAGDDAGAAGLDVDLGEVCTGRGELDRAQAFLDRAAGHAERTGDRRLAGRAQVALAELALARGELARADDGFAAAAAALHGDDDAVARCLAGRAVIAAERGLVDTGARLAADAEAMAVDALTSGRAALAAAAVAWRAGDAAQATAGFRRAIAVFADHGLRRDLAEAHLRFGLFCGEIAEQGGRGPALTPLDAPAGHLARAQELLRATGNLGDLERVRTAFRRFGRRATDRPAPPELGQLLTDLRQQRLVVQETAGRLVDGAAIADRQVALTTLDDALRELALAEDRLVAAVHAVVVERESIRGLLELTRTLAAVDDYAALPGAIARLACQLTGGDRALTYLTDGGRGAWAIDPAVDRSWAGAVAEAAAGGPQLHGGRRGDRTTSREGGSSPPLGHAMTAPLRAGGRILGALWVDRAPTGGLFAARDLDLLSVFAGQAAAILDNARIAEALRLAARTTTATLEAISDGVVAIDTSGAITAINASGARILGLGRSEAEAVSVWGRTGPASAPAPSDRPPRRTPSDAVNGVVRGADTSGDGAPLLDVLRASLARGEELDGRVVQLAAGEYVCTARFIRGDGGAAVGLVATFTEGRRATRLAQRMVGSTARYALGDIVGDSPALRRCLALAEAAAGADASVLVTGESGTGKELVAQAIHNAGPRAGGPFVAVNCAAIPRELLESELFGYDAGAFTGARRGGRPGKFELADGGTILLDEIGELPLDMQAKLLRALQERTTTRLGGSRETAISCRIIATTNRDLAGEVRRGRFRQDLFFRLRVIHVELPPLRERPGDIAQLAQHFLAASSARLGKRLVRLAPEVADAFARYPWPGNVRELEHIVESEVTLAPPDREVVTEIPAGLRDGAGRADAPAAAWPAPPWLSDGAGWPPPPWAWPWPYPAPPRPPAPSPGASAEPEPAPVKTLSDSERELLVAALTSHRGRIPAVARALGVSRGTVYNKMRKFNLDPERFR